MQGKQPTSGHLSRSGFTLVEVLVASAVMAILLLGLFQVTGGAMDAWAGGSSKLQAQRDARMVFDMLRTDLESMVYRQTNSNQEWLLSAPDDSTGDNTRLYFFAPSLGRQADQRGDVTAVQYRVVEQDVLGGDNTLYGIPGLYRAIVDTTNTFNGFLASDDLEATWGLWDGGAPTPSDSPGNLLAPYIVDFQCSWYQADGSRRGQENTVRQANNLSINGAVQTAPLVALDVRLTFLEAEAIPQWRLSSDKDAVIRRHGHSFSQRIDLDR